MRVLLALLIVAAVWWLAGCTMGTGLREDESGNCKLPDSECRDWRF